MNRFAIAQPKTFEEAAARAADKQFKLPVIKAGGTDLLDHLKEGLIEPDLLIDIRRLRLDAKQDPVRLPTGGKPQLEIDATATLADIVDSPIIAKEAPVLAQSLAGAATPQIRNMATAAGNLLQRPRCWYYRSEQFKCLKKGGSVCFAAEGENRYHAIFGDGPSYIVHPSNLAPALYVCNADIGVIGGGRRSIPIADLFHLPDAGVRSEHNLKPGEIITHITAVPAPKSGFYSIKEKQSFDWPVVMAAVALRLDGDTILHPKVCAGAVAPIPWPLPNVEQALAGVNINDDAALRKACAVAAEGAKPLGDNKYKVKLLPVAVRRAVLRAAGKPFEPEAKA